MKKISMIAVLTTVLALFGSGVSYAAPTQKAPMLAADTSQVTLTPELLTQAVAELKAAGIPHETVNDTKGEKTTFHLKQGLSFTLVEPATAPSVNAFVSGGWRFMYGPYIDFNRFEQGLMIGGAGLVVGKALCLIPGVGTVACLAIEVIILVVGQALSYRSCRGDFRYYLYGGPNGCL